MKIFFSGKNKFFRNGDPSMALEVFEQLTNFDFKNWSEKKIAELKFIICSDKIGNEILGAIREIVELEMAKENDVIYFNKINIEKSWQNLHIAQIQQNLNIFENENGENSQNENWFLSQILFLIGDLMTAKYLHNYFCADFSIEEKNAEYQKIFPRIHFPKMQEIVSKIIFAIVENQN